MSADPAVLDDGAPRRRVRVLFLLPVLIFLGLAALFLVRLYSGDPSKVPSALIGRPVPAFTLPSLPGLRGAGGAIPGLSSEDLKGRVTVVNIWASWCGPCREEHPALVELAKDPGFRLVGINYKDIPENARRFLGALGNPFQAVGVDANGRAAIDWGVYGVPETFVIGPDGTIRHKHIGPILPEQLPGFLAKVKDAAR
ncbi:DsbE family thiol:disulfide interchange protein [Salinarimonas soli]|uniref:DsbE family thiol:disulfide interchange protein n=1 Tax=Salinarimonas soli TaxID=1638099 RepID=A0A5B2VT09_9HYPH|nr:DsbE family thiol:disulfide interchange protein [Salinarimonas soli]KAA2241259.1 DsbE family thiol:disulfide interchange protein [Salinarimonas soli]